MERFRELGIIAVVVLTAAYGPELVVNSFYFSSWESDWVQAASATVAVLVALFLPMLRDYKHEKRIEESRVEMETIAVFAIYHEALRLRVFFKRVVDFIGEEDFDGLYRHLTQDDELTGNGYGRFDVASSLGREYAEHYYVALTRKVALKSTSFAMLSVMARQDEFGSVVYRGDSDDAVFLRLQAEGLAREGYDVSQELREETESRSVRMRLD